MALFGRNRDIDVFKTVTRELVEDIISQQIGYYKVKLGDTKPNIYGESLNKYYIGPVLIDCLIERGDYAWAQEDFGRNLSRSMTYRFFKDHLIEANVFPEVGDVIMYNESYFEVDSLNENQLVVGKDNQYAYSEGLEVFGNSYSIILTTHYVSPDKLGINQNRL